jgi:Gpi18-like mannosyltransferase
VRRLSKRTAVIAAVILIAAAHYLAFARYDSGDARDYLIPWYEHIVRSGRIAAFANPFGNYTPPYLYLLSASTYLDGAVEPAAILKLLAGVGAIWLAVGMYDLLRAVRSAWAFEGALGVLALPSVILNVSLLGQADCFWVAPCILAVASAARNRLVPMAVWAGVAIAFKAQAAFLAPFVISILLQQRAPLICWAIPPLIYAALMVPAWLVGWPATDLATIYLRQAAWQPEGGGIFVSNGASWWTIYGTYVPDLAIRTFWFGYLTTFAATVFFIHQVERLRISGKTLIAVAAIGAAMVPWLLPGMHDRYLLLADVLAYAWAVTSPSRRSIAAAILMQIASVAPVVAWAFSMKWLAPPACFFALAAMLLLWKQVREESLDDTAVPQGLASSFNLR